MSENILSAGYIQDKLDKSFKNKLKTIVFLELNKDLIIDNKFKLTDNLPLPIKTDGLIEGIKASKYEERIDFELLAEGMVCVIACDKDFKYNEDYINILKGTTEKIDSYLLSKSMELASKGEFIDALTYLITLEKISDNHMIIWYNIGLILKEMVFIKNEKGSTEEHDLFYQLSFEIFEELSEIYPHFSKAYYIMGFYYSNEEKYQEAILAWQKAYELSADSNTKAEIEKLIQNENDKLIFMEAKQKIIDGEAEQGLKMIIPLIGRHDDWSEAKYFTALGYRKIQNYKKAELLLNELIKAGESFHEIYNELGLCCMELGNVDNALKNLKTAVELNKDSGGYNCNLAIAYYYAGDDAKAKEYLKKAKELEPNDEIIVKCIRWMKLNI
ncbi:lipoprotein NlpI [Oxobacter pfennigii]|uniref:Lipoprotein NlpI n=1 Tax=Oxobacter pfennigii TaxID=36849 RepID=A0A0P9AIU3_9CLOT|nr:tetratricopeptide repeat protein [Oxobacter pfennigii]KPU45372.1 lipoprotein NlpI [Oxobacter pfennigii]